MFQAAAISKLDSKGHSGFETFKELQEWFNKNLPS